MASYKLRHRRSLIAAAVGVVAVAALGGTALALGLPGTVKSYTGCLTTSGGTLSMIKEGDAPMKPCPSGSTEAHLSGGDITKVVVSGPGLMGGGDNGDVTIQLDPKYGLRQDCARGQVLKWNDVSSSWFCAADNDTKYTRGTGLELNGTEFSIASDYQVKNGQACDDANEFVNGLDSTGKLDCDAPDQTPIRAYSATSGYVHVAGTSTIISKTLPAGKYVLFAQIRTFNANFTTEGAEGDCALGSSSFHSHLPEDISGDNAALTAVVSHPGGALELTCTEDHGDFDVDNAALTAIAVDSVG